MASFFGLTEIHTWTKIFFDKGNFIFLYIDTLTRINLINFKYVWFVIMEGSLKLTLKPNEDSMKTEMLYLKFYNY